MLTVSRKTKPRNCDVWVGVFLPRTLNASPRWGMRNLSASSGTWGSWPGSRNSRRRLVAKSSPRWMCEIAILQAELVEPVLVTALCVLVGWARSVCEHVSLATTTCWYFATWVHDGACPSPANATFIRACFPKGHIQL